MTITITKKETDPSFSNEVVKLPGGEHLHSCYSCGSCSGICPVSQAIPDFDPRKIIHMIRMGLKDKVLKSDLLWYCSGCRSCVFVCPQDVGFADIISALHEMALNEGIITEHDLRDKGRAAWVESSLCVSCLTCVRVCPWDIPELDSEGVARIDARECRACGICVHECPARAIRLNQAEDDRLIAAAG